MSQKIRMISSRGTRSYVANDSEKIYGLEIKIQLKEFLETHQDKN